nr:Plug domain-containing protein [Methylogaea oryzae]
MPRAGGAAVFLYATAIWSATVHGAATQLDAVVVTGSGSETASGELGATASASQGVVDQRTLQSRPLSRVGELVEVVPGAVATQHSGSGKANQFFLRGFNLDHGTDFSVAVDGVPMNMPSHAHGQGYLDLNSIIPELVDHADYGKGPYHADVGDFASAGYARMYTADSLPQGFVKFTGGEFGYYRTVAADSQKLGQGELLYAGEAAFYDGPWKTPEGSGKYNGLLKYSLAQDDWGLSLVGKGYHADWTATNQIAQRAVDSGLVGRYGSWIPATAATAAATALPATSGAAATPTRTPSTFTPSTTTWNCSPISPTTSTIRSTATSSTKRSGASCWAATANRPGTARPSAPIWTTVWECRCGKTTSWAPR